MQSPFTSASNFLWENFKPYKWWGLLVLQAPLLSAFFLFGINYSLKLLTDAFTVTQTGYSYIIYPIIFFIAAQLTREISWRLSNIGELKSVPYIRRNVLLQAYDYIQYHSYSFFQNTQSGAIISKLKGILEGFDYFVGVPHSLIKNFCHMVVAVFALLQINFYVFMLIFLWCLLLISVMYPMCLKLNDLSNDSAESTHRLMSIFSDNIMNIFSVFYFSKRKQELRRVDRVISADCIAQQLKVERYSLFLSTTSSILYILMLISVFVLMLQLRKTNPFSPGDFLFVMLTTLSVADSLWDFVSEISEFFKKVGDFRAAFSLLATPHGSHDLPTAVDAKITHGNISFKNVSFAYTNEKPLFTNLNLEIKAGEKIGIVGPSGSGKSTLISLLLKNFNPTEGSIMIDGKDIAEITADSLRAHVSFIPQDIMLFHRSIGENIGYAKEHAFLHEIKEAARLARLDEFIESLPEKYNTPVGERGLKMSGGQRQRIAIARALLKKAPIIILDEATSALDGATEHEIQESMNAMLSNNKATIIAIAHRLSTLRYMDRIIVMENGSIIEQGTFKGLLREDTSYFKKIWDNQAQGMII